MAYGQVSGGTSVITTGGKMYGNCAPSVVIESNRYGAVTVVEKGVNNYVGNFWDVVRNKNRNKVKKGVMIVHECLYHESFEELRYAFNFKVSENEPEKKVRNISYTFQTDNYARYVSETFDATADVATLFVPSESGKEAITKFINFYKTKNVEYTLKLTSDFSNKNIKALSKGYDYVFICNSSLVHDNHESYLYKDANITTWVHGNRTGVHSERSYEVEYSKPNSAGLQGVWCFYPQTFEGQKRVLTQNEKREVLENGFSKPAMFFKTLNYLPGGEIKETPKPWVTKDLGYVPTPFVLNDAVYAIKKIFHFWRWSCFPNGYKWENPYTTSDFSNIKTFKNITTSETGKFVGYKFFKSSKDFIQYLNKDIENYGKVTDEIITSGQPWKKDDDTQWSWSCDHTKWVFGKAPVRAENLKIPDPDGKVYIWGHTGHASDNSFSVGTPAHGKEKTVYDSNIPNAILISNGCHLIESLSSQTFAAFANTCYGSICFDMYNGWYERRLYELIHQGYSLGEAALYVLGWDNSYWSTQMNLMGNPAFKIVVK